MGRTLLIYAEENQFLLPFIENTLSNLKIYNKYTSNSVKVDIKSYADLIDYIQYLDKDWMNTTKRC